MPTQEDRVRARMRQIQAYIRDEKPKSEKLYAWAHLTLGIRERTSAQYVKSLMIMGIITYIQEEDRLIPVVEKDKVSSL